MGDPIAESIADALVPRLVERLAPMLLEVLRRPTQPIPQRGPADVAEAAEVLRCHQRTVRRMIADGRLTAVSTGAGGSARVLVDRASLERLAGVSR